MFLFKRERITSKNFKSALFLVGGSNSDFPFNNLHHSIVLALLQKERKLETVSQALCSLLLKTDCRSARLNAKASRLNINRHPIHSFFPSFFI